MDIRLKRGAVDTYPRKVLLHIVAHEFAHKADDVENPDIAARLNEPREHADRRVAMILERWGYPAREKMEYTAADRERVRANSALAANDDAEDDFPEPEV